MVPGTFRSLHSAIIQMLTALQDHASLEDLKSSKSRKEVVITGAARFNAKPKLGLAYLEENGLIYADISPEVTREESLARFLKSCSRLDKRLLGDFISRPDNIKILEAFIGLFEFRNVNGHFYAYSLY